MDSGRDMKAMTVEMRMAWLLVSLRMLIAWPSCKLRCLISESFSSSLRYLKWSILTLYPTRSESTGSRIPGRGPADSPGSFYPVP